jgi:hypothetical protein
MGTGTRRLLLALIVACLFTSAWPAARPRHRPRKPAPAQPPTVQLWQAPPVDLGALLAADEADRPEGGGPYRVGVPLKAGLSPDNSGTWETRPDGERIWRLRVRSPGALWLALSFGTFRLQTGASLTVSDAAGRRVLGPYTREDGGEQGRLLLPPLAGDTAVLELRWPRAHAALAPNLHLGQLTHGYRPLGGLDDAEPQSPDGTTPSFCNIDVNCALGSAWQQQKLGIVQLLIPSGAGTLACSGSLINNTALDCRPLVLTAWHCFHPSQSVNLDPAATTFRFNYENPGCGTGTPNTNQTLIGATQVSASQESDFMLLELAQPVPSNYSAYYNGWSRSPDPAPEVWCIHHPAGEPRKISHSDDAVTHGSELGLFTWRVADWEEGTTEQGSSGAPLFDPQQRIVGQLRGGNLSCATGPPFFEAFGKLDRSWSRPGSSPADRLCEALDPVHAELCAAGGETGVVDLDGLAPTFCLFPRPDLVRRRDIVDDVHGNVNQIPEPGDRFKLRVELHNRGTLPATNVTGTLSTSHPDVTILDPTASWPDLAPVDTALPVAPFNVELSPSLGCGEPISFNLSVVADGVQNPWNSVVSLTTATVQLHAVLAEDVESGPNGFTSESASGTNSWVQSTALSSSPSHSWFVADLAALSDTRLLTPAPGIPLPQESVLRFKHFFNTEREFDGAVLEYSTNGTSWIDAGSLVTRGGYNTTISSLTGSPIANRQAWSGDSGSFQDVEIDLSSLAGATVRFRWRFVTDASTGDVGWYVDDIRLDRVDYLCQGPRRQPTPQNRIVSAPH